MTMPVAINTTTKATVAPPITRGEVRLRVAGDGLAVRYAQLPEELRPAPLVPAEGACPASDGCRHNRSSGEIHPRWISPGRSPPARPGRRPPGPLPPPRPRPPRLVSEAVRRGSARPVSAGARWPYDDGVARDLAIDLGTANTLVYARGKGIVLNQPTVIALNTRTHEVLAVGNEAWRMIGRTPGYIVAVRPLREGAITDFDITERMIRLLLRRAGVTKLSRPRVLICVPSAITSVERRAVKEAARRAGASAAHLIEQPMAAAIGAGLDIHEPVGNMVVDVGGGTTETAVISLGGSWPSQTIRCGGFDMDAAIQHYVRHEHGVAIGERTGEELKLAIGSALPYVDEVKAEVRGREVRTGLPKTVVLSPEEVRFALADQVELIVDTVVRCLSESPPELAQDIIYEGIHLVGGGALLRGLANRLADETEVPVHLVATPLECVVLGAGLASTRSTASGRSSPLPSPDPARCFERRSLEREQVLGNLAHLPVAVLEASAERRVDLGTVERGECHRGPSTDGRLVVQRVEHRGQPGRITDRAECGHCSLAAEWIAMARRHRRKLAERSRPQRARRARRAPTRPSRRPSRHRRATPLRGRPRDGWRRARSPTPRTSGAGSVERALDVRRQ